MSKLVSITQGARELRISLSLLRYPEQHRILPLAQRIEGLNRRVYTDDDFVALRKWREKVSGGKGEGDAA